MECRWQCAFFILQSLLIFFVENCFAENLILYVNIKKPIAVTDDAFLSFTLDPNILLHNIDDDIQNIEKSINMARSLAPAYVRFAGPQSNVYLSEQTDLNDVAANLGVLSEIHWALIYRWTKNVGLNVITCIAPRFIESESKIHPRDPTNIAEFLSFNDQMGYNISWQLGYECQTRCELSGEDLGRYVRNLRNLLESYPGYSNSLIIGPDIVGYRTMQQQRYLQDYFHSAGNALSAITWHPNFDSISLNNGNISVHYDNLAAETEEIYKLIGRAAGNKPLWIAESKPEKYKCQYLGALIWTRRLGNAAKLGIDVIMRQPQVLNNATPDYWVSLLHKTLVGREVLEMKTQHSDKDKMHFYSQCTKPSALYDKGAITIFGVNFAPETVTARLKGLKIKTLHKYILSPDSETGDKMFSEKVLLNDKPLNLIDDQKVPDLHPEIITGSDNLELELSSGDIGFWVIPDAQVKACTYSKEETVANSVTRKLSKRDDAVQRNNQDREEKDQSMGQSNLHNRKTCTKDDRRKRKNVENENQQNIWNSKLLGRIKRVLQKKFLRTKKSNSSNYQSSVTVVLKEGQGDSSEKENNRTSLNNNLETADKRKDVHNILQKHKRSLLEKKDQVKLEDLKSENLDAATLISNIDTLTKLDEGTITSNELTELINGNEDEIKNKANLNVGTDGKFKEYYALENFSKKVNVIYKVKRFFDTFFNTLQDSESTMRDDKNNQISDQENSMEEKRFKRDLNRSLENSKNVKILDKRSQIDDLKNDLKRKVKRRIVLRKKNQTSDKNCDKDKSNRRGLLRRDPVKRFLDNEASSGQTDHHSARQEFLRESKRRKKNNINRDFAKIDDLDNYQEVQKLERAKREMAKKLGEIILRKENVFRKRSRIDDAKDSLIERKVKKSDSKREGLLIPFNPRITESGENNFYGFFRREPINNFPEGDIFVSTGDSLEQNGKDYDYVEDDDDSLKKNTQHQQVLDCTEDNSYEKPSVDDNYVANEFFENVKLSDTRIKEGSTDYSDLWEAQYFPEEHENTNINVKIESGVNNNKRSISHNLEVDFKSNEEKDKKLKMNSESIVSFYRPAQVFAARYNYPASTIKDDEAKLSKENISIANMSENNDNNTQPAKFYRSTELRPTSTGDIQNVRAKRSNWKKLNMEFAREMIEEDENNAKDCHCRVIRASDSSKKSYYCDFCRVKRDNEQSDSSSEIEDVDSTHFARNARDFMTKDDYEKIMTGEILPSASISSSEYADARRDTITESVARSSEMDYKSKNTLQTTNAVTSLMDSSTINNSEQSGTEENSITHLPLYVVTTLRPSLSSDSTTEDITKETFFRTQSANIETEIETTTYDLPENNYRIHSNNRKNHVPSSVTRAPQKTTRDKKEAIGKKEKTENSTHSATTTTNQEDEKRYEDDYTPSLKTSISLEEITEEVAKEATTETSLSKRAIDKSIDNSKFNETEIKQKSQRNTDDNLTRKFEADEKDLASKNDAKRTQNVIQHLPKAPLRAFARIEENLIKRAEEIDKRKERLFAKRKKLMQQYHQELSQIADEQNRNLKRREAWEKFCESDDFRQLINKGEFIGVLIDDAISYEDDEECSDEEEHEGRYVIPIELTSKQYDALLDQIHPFAEKTLYPEHDRFQLLRQLKLLEDEQDTAESISASDDKIFAIDPSTYDGGEPTLQDYRDNFKAPKYPSRIKFQMPEWILKDFQAYLRKSDRDQHSISKLQKYMKKSPDKNYDNREKTDVLYVLGAQRQSEIPKEFARVWLSPIDRRDITRAARNKIQVESSNRNFEEKHDVLNSVPVTDEEAGLTRNEEFGNFNNRKEGTSNFRITKDTKDADKMMTNEKLENMRSTRDMKADKDTRNEQSVDVNNKEEDKLNMRMTKDVKNVETIQEIEDSAANKEETLNTKSRKAVAKTRRLNRKHKNIIEDKDTEMNKSYNSKENLNVKVSNNNEAVENVERVADTDAEPSKLEQEIIRTRRSTAKPTSNKYLEQSPYFLLTKNNERNSRNRDMHVYLENNSEEIFKKRLHIFLKKISDSIDTDNSLEDFWVPAEMPRLLKQYIVDLMNEYSDDESSEEFKNYNKALLFLSKLLNENAEDTSYQNLYSESEQDISIDDEDVGINYKSRKEDTSLEEQRGFNSGESDKYSKMKDKRSCYSPIQFHRRGMLLLLPRRNEKRHRREIESLRQDKSFFIRNLEDESAEYYLNDNNVNEEERNKIMKTKDIDYLKPKVDKENHDDLLEDFIEARKKSNLYNNEIPLGLKDKVKDIKTANKISESRELSSLLETPISENLIISLEGTSDLPESVEQFDDNLENEFKETVVLNADSKNVTSETNRNNVSSGFVQNLLVFLTEILRIFMFKS